VGGLIDLTSQVMDGSLQNGFLLARPPSHHANNRSSSGFCIFNSVGLTIQNLQRRVSGIKVAVFDFDVHFCDGTASMFAADSNVLCMSIHRHDNGAFYPGKCGSLTKNGTGAGKGYTVNVPINVTEMGDREYLEALKTVFLPIMSDFDPDVVFISAGFDCAHGDANDGNMHVSSAGFAHMTALIKHSLKRHQKLIMSMEGGYNVHALSRGMYTSASWRRATRITRTGLVFATQRHGCGSRACEKA
jgi:histone deacetylase 6